MTTPTNDPRIGQNATYVGREVSMRITGTIFSVDDRYIWIRDSEGRERGCRPQDVRIAQGGRP